MNGMPAPRPQGNADLLIPAQLQLVALTSAEVDAYVSALDREAGKRLAEDLIRLKVILTELGKGKEI